MNALDALKDRGFAHQFTDEATLAKVLDKPTTFYIGFDPTADSLHVGSLMPVMAAAHMQRFGHIPIMLVGGGTGIVGDPSGKAEDRNMLSYEVLKHYEECLKKQLESFVTFEDGKGYLLNNYDWLKDLNYLTFLRDIGRYFRVNQMLENETYKIKMEANQGLSFIEFNYQLLQAYDFKFLFEKYNCILQIGGSDQWANITAGTGLVRKSLGKEVFGMTIPLLTTSTGKKMGKTEQGAVWLDKSKTSVFDFYQFWVNTTDADVKKFLKIFTFLEVEYINSLSVDTVDELKFAKKLLAKNVCEIVHGVKETEEAIIKSENIFEKSNNLSVAQIVKVNIGDSLVDVIHAFDNSLSKTEIRRRISAKAIKLNNVPIEDTNLKIDQSMFVNNKALLTVTKISFFSMVL